jgi:hypothetical protein
MGITQRLLLTLLCLWPAWATARTQTTAGNGVVFDYEDRVAAIAEVFE